MQAVEPVSLRPSRVPTGVASMSLKNGMLLQSPNSILWPSQSFCELPRLLWFIPFCLNCLDLYFLNTLTQRYTQSTSSTQWPEWISMQLSVHYTSLIKTLQWTSHCHHTTAQTPHQDWATPWPWRPLLQPTCPWDLPYMSPSPLPPQSLHSSCNGFFLFLRHTSSFPSQGLCTHYFFCFQNLTIAPALTSLRSQ